MVFRGVHGLFGVVRHHVPPAEGEEPSHQSQEKVGEGAASEESARIDGLGSGRPEDARAARAGSIRR